MGGIFAWFGDEHHQEADEFDMPEEFVSDEWSAMLCTAHWKCNWTYAVDNVMDPMHGAYPACGVAFHGGRRPRSEDAD